MLPPGSGVRAGCQTSRKVHPSYNQMWRNERVLPPVSALRHMPAIPEREPDRLLTTLFRTTPAPLRHRLLLTCLCASLLLLAGCPGDTATTVAGSAGSTTAQATAPTLQGPGGAAGKTQAGAAAQTATAQANPQSAMKAQQIVAKAQASYNSGVANYRANRLDAARLDFDYAVDTMLSSGLDLKGDTEVADQFEHLLDAINTLEMAALKQGNGFSPKIEAAPLESAEDITFPPNPELVARLRNELNVASDLPLVINDQVAGYIGVFSTSNSFRAHMAASLQRVGKYRGLIQRVLKEEGVPQDLIYLAVAESGFQPQVVNGRSGAGGMWQFMTYTGAEYGLTRTGYDYRFDPEKSSRAYARYIKKLYEQFGDWYLAMAAYDWGPGAVQHAVQRTGYADFWELYRRNAMPAETRAYVPQILAAVIMAKNPEKYGLDKLVPSPAVIYDTVSTSYSIDVRLVADVTNATVSEIVALNPALLRLETPPDTSFDLHIPPGTKDLFNERLKDIPQDRRASWRFHVVKPGESLDGIASSLHARVADIADSNGITPQDPMAVGDELVVPIQTVATAAHPQRYTVRRGDTLVTVADSFNVSVEQLRSWNALSSSSLRPGRTLYVAEPIRRAVSGRSRKRGGRCRHCAVGASSRGSHGSSSKASRSSAKSPGSTKAHGAATSGHSKSTAAKSAKHRAGK
jgi:membrane-bound lytic murein transglycosylase D